MTDVEINVTGEMENPYEKNVADNNGFELPRIQIPLGQFGHPKAQEWIQHRRATLRPWSVFLATNNFRPPPNISRLSKRVVKNIEYFQSNYFFVFVGLVLYCLLTSPLLLITVVAALFACYKASQIYSKHAIIIASYRLTLAQVYGFIGICSLPLFYLVGAGAVLFWVLGIQLLL
ncbi:prenylated Rab acceptor protein 1-like [Copidosoma floridanum]|uniref:prenylated Rab acceptor protein 1-like n=1 Tax=Copidosoma floridanum TaxID=29053 RepID=UPI000C6F82B8|nr:prenylated Rab acceptor protein 1-like [Copidosoma floridanum]